MKKKKYLLSILGLVFIVICIFSFKNKKSSPEDHFTNSNSTSSKISSKDHFTGSSSKLEKISPNRSQLTTAILKSEAEKIVKIAEKRARAVMEIPDDVEPLVEETETLFIVTWPFTVTEDVPRPDYYAQVEIDKKTNEVLNVLSP